MTKQKPMTRAKFDAALLRLDACHEARDWCAENPRMTPARLWATCQRADWLLWLAGNANVDRKTLVLSACDCAETVLRYVPTGETRPAEAIRVMREWCAGRATIEQVRAVAIAAYAANAAIAAYAAYAANAAIAAYAAYVAYAANATYAAYAAAQGTAHTKMCALVRRRLKWADIERGL